MFEKSDAKVLIIDITQRKITDSLVELFLNNFEFVGKLCFRSSKVMLNLFLSLC